MKCQNCGAELPDGAAFCGNCGTATQNTGTPSEIQQYSGQLYGTRNSAPQKKNKKKTKLILLIAAVALAVVVAAVVLTVQMMTQRSYSAYIEAGVYSGGGKLIAYDSAKGKYVKTGIPEELLAASPEEIRGVVSYIRNDDGTYLFSVYDMCEGRNTANYGIPAGKTELDSAVRSEWSAYLLSEEYRAVLKEGITTVGKGLVEYDVAADRYHTDDIPAQYLPANTADILFVVTVEQQKALNTSSFVSPAEDITYNVPKAQSNSSIVTLYQSAQSYRQMVLDARAYTEKLGGVIDGNYTPQAGANKAVYYDNDLKLNRQLPGLAAITASKRGEVRFLVKNSTGNPENYMITDLKTGKTSNKGYSSLKECIAYINQYLTNEAFAAVSADGFTPADGAIGIVAQSQGDYRTDYFEKDSSTNAGDIRFLAAFKGNKVTKVTDLKTGKAIYADENGTSNYDDIYLRCLATAMINDKHSGTGYYLVQKAEGSEPVALQSEYFPGKYSINNAADATNIGGVVEYKSGFKDHASYYGNSYFNFKVTWHVEYVTVTIRDLNGRTIETKTFYQSFTTPDSVKSYTEEYYEYISRTEIREWVDSVWTKHLGK